MSEMILRPMIKNITLDKISSLHLEKNWKELISNTQLVGRYLLMCFQWAGINLSVFILSKTTTTKSTSLGTSAQLAATIMRFMKTKEQLDTLCTIQRKQSKSLKKFSSNENLILLFLILTTIFKKIKLKKKFNFF